LATDLATTFEKQGELHIPDKKALDYNYSFLL